MGIEIERKFLVDAIQWREIAKDKQHTIQQGYIVNTGDKNIRVRIKDQNAFITLKGKRQQTTRAEYEYPVPLADGYDLLQNFCEAIVEKIRYEIMYENMLWELDEFKGENAGLLLAEIELQSEGEEFALPPWIGKEVSGDERYYNAYLARIPYKKWEDKG